MWMIITGTIAVGFSMLLLIVLGFLSSRMTGIVNRGIAEFGYPADRQQVQRLWAVRFFYIWPAFTVSLIMSLVLLFLGYVRQMG